ncbi:MAG: hypothetical protein WC816_15630 [Sphingomonas sp.]|jgi:hypothetical protein
MISQFENFIVRLTSFLGSARNGLASLFMLLFAMVPTGATAQDLKTIPAESFIQAPGAVDLRTGQYIYNQSDVSIRGI